MTSLAFPQVNPASVDRRRLLLGAAALGTAGLHPPIARAQSRAVGTDPAILERAIPSTGERLPALGLGTFMTFDLLPGAPREQLREVVRRYWAGGCRVLDTSPLYGMGEVNAGDMLSTLDPPAPVFVSNKLWATGDFLADPAASERMLEASRQRLWRDRIDLMHVHNLVNVEQNLPLLKVWKAEGRIRYTGVSHHDPAYFDVIADLIERDPPDFVQVRYSIATRAAERRILPAAGRRKVAVGVHMAFEKARLFKLVEGRSVPAFARDAGMRDWAEFFLKWVLARPEVTCVMVATSDPLHASENLAALSGPLPDERTRARMLAFMEALTGFAELDSGPWYPGKRYAGVIAAAQAERTRRLQAAQASPR